MDTDVVGDPDSEPIPSPVVVASWVALGAVTPERVPLWAAHWLAQGLDGPELVALAGLNEKDVREIHDLLPAALRDAGVDPVPELVAAVRLSFDHVARMFLDGLCGWRWVISTVTDTFDQNDWTDEMYAEPLGALFGVEDELVGGWGRPVEEIEVAVREACEQQVRSA